jgi:hypothetical protein
MSRKLLPPLEVAQAYLAVDFESFSYFHKRLIGGSKSILRLTLRNATTIDLPATDEQLQHLLRILCEAFPKEATKHVVETRGWALPKAQNS